MTALPDTPVVHIVEADARVRESTALFLIRQGWAVRTFESGEAFLDSVGPATFGCLVLGEHGHGPHEQDPQTLLLARRIELPVVFLDSHDVPRHLVVANGREARGVTDQPWYRDVLDRRVREAVAWHGERRLLERESFEEAARRNTLTQRELEVLALLEKGLSSKRIGRELDISHRTVDVHRANVMRKLGVSSLSRLRQRQSSGRAGEWSEESPRGEGRMRHAS